MASVAGLLGGCSGSDDSGITGLLPSETDTGLERYTDVVTFTVGSLDAYLGPSAAIYQKYGVVEAATAGYANGEIEMAVDVIRFDNNSNALGLYTIVRPPDSDTLSIGDMGYLDPGKLIFIRGAYMVRITAYEDSDATQKLMQEMAEAVLTRMARTEAKSKT